MEPGTYRPPTPEELVEMLRGERQWEQPAPTGELSTDDKLELIREDLKGVKDDLKGVLQNQVTMADAIETLAKGQAQIADLLQTLAKEPVPST